MNIFALDSSSKNSSIAICSETFHQENSHFDMGLTHSETLLVLINDLFSETKMTPKDIDYFAVTTGPGSFTGLRIGIATIKGLAFPTNTPCVAVSTLEALAESTNSNDLERNTIIVPVIDARRERVYTAFYRRTSKGILENILPETLLTLEQLKEQIAKYEQSIILVGEVSQRCYDYCRDTAYSLLCSNEEAAPLAEVIAEIAIVKIKKGETVSPADLTPRYLQLSQAEREKIEREQK